METPQVEQPLPPLRQGIEMIEMQHEGQPMVMLRDQEGVVESSIAVSLPGFLVATLLNGENKASDIQSIFSKNTGGMVTVAEIQSLVKQLDSAGMLETPSFQEKRKAIWQKFFDSEIREPHHQGGGYPADRLELAAFLGKFFKDSKGPGVELPSAPTEKNPVLGLVSPHIDFHRGGPAYAWAYQKLAQHPIPDVVIGLGVAHMSPNSPWVFTKKRYQTPYGPMEVAKDYFDELAGALWYEPQADEWTHRTEHSLEFQALWLKYLWREKAPAWVPILCSSFYQFASDRAPSTIETVDSAIEKMGAVLKKRKEQGQNILILAGIDLAHVGPRFGDEEKLGPELNARIQREDKISLEHAMRLDADGFYMSMIQGNHWRKACGLSALYTAVRLINILSEGKSAGNLLTYDIADDPLGGVVSFCSAIFPSA